jgi:hypothetical protein
MSRLLVALASTAALAVAASWSLPAIAAPAQAKAAKPYKSLTHFGAPDLQGVWTNATLTPTVRPKVYGDSLILTDADAAKLEAADAAHVQAGLKPTDPNTKTQDLPNDCGRGFTGVNCGYNSFWTDPGTKVLTIDGQKRTSILTQPKNGQFPEMTPQARAAFAKRMQERGGERSFENPEWRALGERCITSFGSSAGPPMLPLLYNNNYQIIQTPDEVAILVEMVHDVRHIRLSTPQRPLTHPSSDIQTWMGDSIGHWEGDTLVISTANIRREQFQRGGSENARVTEWLTRISPTEMLYKFKVEDPSVFTEPYGGELIFSATSGPIYEYACQEGNYALPHILAGAREKERQGLPAGS